MLQSFGVDLPALVEVLSVHLYADKRVAIRELVANARDSLLQLGSQRTPSSGEPCITISIDPRRRRLVVRDNGVGMNAEQVKTHLSILASSGTRLLRQRASQEDPELAKALSGQFGLGFLSTLIIADRVEVRTRSRADPRSAVHWACERGSSGYTMEMCNWDQFGTEVALTLNDAFLSLTSHAGLAPVVKHYCDLVEFPIRLEGMPKPLNRMLAPWNDAETTDAEMIQFLRDTGRLQGDATPLYVDVLRDCGGCNGLFFLPESGDANGEIALYVRHLFVSQGNEYITESLNFVHGVIDCRDLPLTLSRESVIDGSVMRALREQLRDAVLEQLGRLRHRGPRSFRQVLRAYNRPFKMAALRDNRVLERFADELDVKLTTGETMSLAQVTEKSGGGGITFIDNAETQSAHGSLLAARGKPVVDATDRLDWILLQRYGHAKGKAPERADVSAGTLGRLAEGEPWRTLERAVAAIDPTVQPRAVEMDAEVPALFLRGERDVLQDMLAEARERGEGHPAVRLLSGLLSDPQGANAGRPLFLNSRHPVVQAMASALRSSADPGLIRTAIRALIASATAYSEPMDPARRKNVYDAVSEGLLALLTLADSGDAAGADRDLAAKVKQLEADNAQLRARAEAAEQELRAVPPPLLHRFRRSPPQAP